MSTAAYRYSGHVWIARWDSAMTTTPLMPNGLNSWKTTSTMVAWARFAASTRAPLTASRLLMASGSQSNISSRRCRPRAFKPVVPLSIRSSTAPLLRRFISVAITHEKISLMQQNLFHCRVRFYPLQEKNAIPAARSAAGRAGSGRSGGHASGGAGNAGGFVTHSPESQLFELRTGLGGPTPPLASPAPPLACPPLRPLPAALPAALRDGPARSFRLQSED